MIKIGVTGQTGFVGQHLYNTLGLFPLEFEQIKFENDYFKDDSKLIEFVSNCDVIVHLAAMNRHNDPQLIYDTNLGLVKKLISSLEKSKSKAHILFSSSSQEEKDNLYGKSKKEGRELFIKWAESTGGKFSGMIIPNVFGPFGHPNYNSFIATFCHKLTHGEKPIIEIDGLVRLIFVGELVSEILTEIRKGKGNNELVIPHTFESKVSEILSILETYKEDYFIKGEIPNIDNLFKLNLFNTFRSYIDNATHFPVKYTQHKDSRGSFVEIIRLEIGGQVSFSTTVPGITRGNHFHTRKIERFSVIKGNALIQMRKIGSTEVLDFYLDGNEPAYVDMPIWYTHNIMNIGNDVLYTNFWINEFYDSGDSDTYFEVV
jgi:UDP-2-acetamido-2,6-beta-L-arabino-hexul-4-ose reductase